MISDAISIEYHDLSENLTKANQQKDIINQVIRKELYPNQILKETNEILSKSLLIKCKQCEVTNLSPYEIDANSIKIKSKEKDFENEIQFAVIYESGMKESWKFESIEKKSIFYIAAKEPIPINKMIRDDIIEIKSCTTIEKNCNPRKFFGTNEDAKKFMKTLLNKRNNFLLRQGQEIDLIYLSKEIVVKSGEPVILIYKPNENLKIQLEGKALNNASLGETVKVQYQKWNSKTNSYLNNEVTEGVVTAPGEVEYALK